MEEAPPTFSWSNIKVPVFVPATVPIASVIFINPFTYNEDVPSLNPTIPTRLLTYIFAAVIVSKNFKVPSTFN